METAVSRKGQTVVPAPIRKRYRIGSGTRLVWLDDGKTVRVVTVSAEPLKALKGSGRGEYLIGRLLAIRREDRERGK